MGFPGLVPAEQVTAMHFVQKLMLRIQAAGSVPNVTSGIKFDRQPSLGGLKFVLQGWSGPSTEGTSQYDVDLEVSIQLPNPATPSDSLIVVTTNHPEGLPTQDPAPSTPQRAQSPHPNTPPPPYSGQDEFRRGQRVT